MYFIIIIFAVALFVAVYAHISRRRRFERTLAEVNNERIAREEKRKWDQRVTTKMQDIKNQKPHPSEPTYRATVPVHTERRTDSPTYYDPSMDLLSPINPLSPLNLIHHSDHDHSPSPSYSAPDPSPSPSTSHDSGSSYGGDSYGGSSYDSGGGGGGYDGGSSGGGDY